MNRSTWIALVLLASIVSAILSAAAQAQTATAPPLHTSGHSVLDSSNHPVYFRGIGRGGDLDSLSGIWGAPGGPAFDYGQKFQTDTTVLTRNIDQTLACYRDVWKVNLIRLFMPVDWWWQDNFNPAKQYGQGPDHVFSYRSYIELIVREAARHGIYVDLTPYSVFNYYSGQGKEGGIPGRLGAAGLEYMHTINADEIKAWRMWWQSVADRLGQHPNVIFEMWNEPDRAKQPYYNYMIQSYQTIRASGSSNLIFMQWHMGLVPTWTELDWVPELHKQLRSAIGQEPVNVVYTTHPYRHAPYPNLQWATTYEGVKAQLSSPKVIPATRSNGIDVPLVFNEMGICAGAGYSDADPISKEYGFWDALLKNAYEMDVGVVAYYWMQSGTWPGDESLLQGPWPKEAPSPPPRKAGQIFIDSYRAPNGPGMK